MLNRDQCTHVRNKARDAFLVAHGKRRQAIRLARKSLRQDPGSIVGMVLISIAIRLAVWLITKWIENKLSIPDHQYQPDELGFQGLSQAEADGLPSDDLASADEGNDP